MGKSVFIKRILSFFLFTSVLVSFSLKKEVSAVAESSQVYARAECVMEANSRRVLYESNGDTRLPMASTTKIATAITVLEEETDLKRLVSIPPQAVGVEGSSVYLREGEVFSVEDLLYGLMLRSGNDCATALALDQCGTVERFSARMNKLAEKAGALNTCFKNPHGLPCVGHYTTARDLSLITCYAMQNAIFREIVSTKYYEPRHWKNKNKLLDRFDGAVGVKTGYTKEAGRCLVSAAERNGMTLVVSVLNCPSTYERSEKLLEDAFSVYHNVCLVNKEKPLAIESAKKEIVYGYAREDIFYPLLSEEEGLVEIKTFPVKKIEMKRKKEEIVGEFQIFLAKRLLFSGNLYKL